MRQFDERAPSVPVRACSVPVRQTGAIYHERLIVYISAYRPEVNRDHGDPRRTFVTLKLHMLLVITDSCETKFCD